MIAKFTKKSKPYFLWRKNIYANIPHYSERISYDLNSNISALSRHGFQRKKNIAKYYGLLDSLVIYRGGNQLRMITDMATTDYGHPAEYRDGAATWYEHNHDKNGNLVCDLDRGVTSIGYNILNLPESVVFTGNHATYNIYDSDGRKLRTIHVVAYDPVVMPGGETVIPADTLVRDYSGGHIYENGVLERIITPNGYYADGKYFYYIKDYQGNNVAVVTRANNTTDVVSATLTYPYGGELTELSATDRYRFGGKEFDTRGGLFHYDFEARHYDPVLPMFNGYDPMAEDNIHVSPLAYCHGNPVMFIDPTGMTIQGNTREDAVNLVSDIRSIFKDEAFNQFRDLITQSGKKHNGKSLEKISDEALKLAFDGISLTEDQQALVDVVVNTINSEDKHIVEYSKGEGNISANALSAMYDGFKNLPMSVILSANGGFPVAFVKNMGGGGLTAQTQKGSYTVIVDEPSLHEYGRPLTTGHEIFGHGRSLALGRISNDQQHIDAIQMENLIRRVMGIKSVNDGRNHMNGKIISNPNELPGYR